MQFNRAILLALALGFVGSANAGFGNYGEGESGTKRELHPGIFQPKKN